MNFSNCITGDIKQYATMIILGRNQLIYVFNDVSVNFPFLLILMNTQIMQRRSFAYLTMESKSCVRGLISYQC